MCHFILIFTEQQMSNSINLLTDLTENHAGILYILQLKVGLAAGIGSLFLITNPYLATSAILLRVVGFSMAAAIPSGIWASQYHISKSYNNKLKIETKMNKNKEHEKTDDDMAREEFARKLNSGEPFYDTDDDEKEEKQKEQEPIYETSYISYISDFRILGLNPLQKITMAQLKTAYHDNIKKWHPDRFVGNQKTANEMCSRVNTAYERLQKIIK